MTEIGKLMKTILFLSDVASFFLCKLIICMCRTKGGLKEQHYFLKFTESVDDALGHVDGSVSNENMLLEKNICPLLDHPAPLR